MALGHVLVIVVVVEGFHWLTGWRPDLVFLLAFAALVRTYTRPAQSSPSMEKNDES